MMKLNIIALGRKMPAWVEAAYQDYAKRLAHACQLNLVTLDSKLSSKNLNSDAIQTQESQLLLQQVPVGSHVVMLDKVGQSWSTPDLATQLEHWQVLAKPISILIGGAEGFSRSSLAQGDQVWSLSKLTFPHPLVRVILIEQLYRAWSILQNHPYHRA